jgi:hypothetical protein
MIKLPESSERKQKKKKKKKIQQLRAAVPPPFCLSLTSKQNLLPLNCFHLPPSLDFVDNGFSNFFLDRHTSS